MRFKINWAILIVGTKFTIFFLFYFVFDGNFPSASPPGAYIRRGNLTEGFWCDWFGGLIHGRAYFQNFMVFAVHAELLATTWNSRYLNLEIACNKFSCIKQICWNLY